MILKDWLTAVADTWALILERLVNFLPNLIGALIIVVIGWIVGLAVALILDRFFRIIGLQVLFEKAKVEDVLKKGNIEQDSSALLASAVKWVIYLVSFIAAANTLKLPDVANFLDRILNYVPAAIAAMAIVLIGLVLANFLSAVVRGSVQATGLYSANALAAIVKYAITVFALLAALVQLGIAESLLRTLFIGVVAFFAIAGGLAFGLGGKDAAADWIEKVRKEIKD